MSQDKWKGKNLSYMTPQMMHAMKMSQMQSQNTYKKKYNEEVKGTGFKAAGESLEAQRAKKNTNEQSLHNYHKTFENEKAKGYTTVSDTPEMNRFKKVSQFSDVTYHKEYMDEKQKGYTTVSDTPEFNRIKKVNEFSDLKYHKEFEEDKQKGYTAVEDTPELTRINAQKQYQDTQYKKDFFEQRGQVIPVVDTPENIRIQKQQKFLSDIKYQEDKRNMAGKVTQVTDDPNLQRVKQATKISSDIQYKSSKEKTAEMERRKQEILQQQNIHRNQKFFQTTQPTQFVQPPRQQTGTSRRIVLSQPMHRYRRQPGSIYDYDPSDYETEVETRPTNASAKRSHIRQAGYQSDYTRGPDTDDDDVYSRLVKWDPHKHRATHISTWTNFIPGKSQAHQHVPAPGSMTDYQNLATETQKMSIQSAPAPVEQKKMFVALFDYSAADDDEVSFNEGDVITDTEIVDDGWMVGRVQRTGQMGMLPSNYVQVQ